MYAKLEATAAVRSATTPEGRLHEALQSEEASEATVQLKHFSRSLQSSHLTQPAQVPAWSIFHTVQYVHKNYPLTGHAEPCLQ